MSLHDRAGRIIVSALTVGGWRRVRPALEGAWNLNEGLGCGFSVGGQLRADPCRDATSQGRCTVTQPDELVCNLLRDKLIRIGVIGDNLPIQRKPGSVELSWRHPHRAGQRHWYCAGRGISGERRGREGVFQASLRGGSSGLPAKYAARAYGLFFPSGSDSVKPPSDGLSVRVSVFGMDHPPLRSTSAGHTAQEHGAVDAANRVVMPGDIASNPVPHGRFLFQTVARPTARKVPRSEGLILRIDGAILRRTP